MDGAASPSLLPILGRMHSSDSARPRIRSSPRPTTIAESARVSETTGNLT